MEILIQDLRFALRSLRRTPGFTAVVVAVLALGIGVNTMIFSMVYGVMMRPWPLPDFGRVMTILESNPAQDTKDASVSWLNYEDLLARSKSFSAIGGYWDGNGNVTIGEEPEQMQYANISSGVLPALGVRPVLGRGFTRDEEVYGQNWTVALISERVWHKRFGGAPGVLGQTLRINGRVRTIVGVLPKDFHWPEVADYWIPTAISEEDRARREDHNMQIVARLRDGVTMKQANAEVAGIYKQLVQENPVDLKGWSGRVDGYMAQSRRGMRVMMTIMSVAVGLVLLIACANVANLMLARAAARKREMSVRLALGASRGRVIRQMLTESVLLSLAGAGLGTVLAIAGNRIWIGMIPLEIPFWLKFQIDAPVLAFTVALSTLSAVVFGLLPALHASDARLSEALREGSAQAGTGRDRGRARNALVVAEVALSLALLVASGLMVRSLFAMMDSERLVQTDGIYTARFLLPIATWPGDSARRVFCDRVVPLARQLPGVRSASIVNLLPLNRNSNGTQVYTENGARNDKERGLRTNFTECYPDYFQTLGIRLVKGRDFTMDDGPGAPAVAIVNESLAKALWPGKDPLGQRFNLVGDGRKLGWRTVVGVVADVPQNLEDNERVSAVMFVPHRQEPDQTMSWVIRVDGDPAAFAGEMRRFMRTQTSDVPLTDVRSMHDAVQFAVWTSRLFGSLMAVFAILALIIAAVGLYGVMAYSVAQRTQEIGIRMALGAQSRDVVNLVVGQALQLMGLGAGIGFAAAYGLSRLIASQLFGISASDPPTWIGVVLILTLSSVLAAWVPAYRATRVDPMRALRCD
ncbi:MAG: ABC transporter permease [Candidatus Eisenbacteria bacterium]